jgi:hypothetical protein
VVEGEEKMAIMKHGEFRGKTLTITPDPDAAMGITDGDGNYWIMHMNREPFPEIVKITRGDLRFPDGRLFPEK